MCDIAFQREKIDDLILKSISPFAFSGPWNEAALVELAFASLSEQFYDLCAESCMRARCAETVGRALRLWRAAA